MKKATEDNLADFARTDKQFLKLQAEADKAFFERQRLEKKRQMLFKKNQWNDIKELDIQLKKTIQSMNEMSNKSLKLLYNKQRELAGY
jgi:hypothetical protein